MQGLAILRIPGSAPRSATGTSTILGPILALGVLVGDMPTALAQAPASAGQLEGPASPGTMQIATEEPRRRRQRPPVDPTTRELRLARGLLAGGIVLTTICSAGFGLFTYAVVDARGKLSGPAGARTVAAGGALLTCTLASIAGIGIGASRLRALRRSGRIVWTGGLGFRF